LATAAPLENNPSASGFGGGQCSDAWVNPSTTRSIGGQNRDVTRHVDELKTASARLPP
jgi:hypothetical protein